MKKYVPSAMAPEVVEDLGRLNEIKVVVTKVGKRTRVQQDFSACVSIADFSEAHMTDLNWLFETMRPDELQAFMAARASQRQPVYLDLTGLPSTRQDLMNLKYEMSESFKKLPTELKTLFGDPLGMVKSLSSVDTREKLEKLGFVKASAVPEGKGEEASEARKSPEPEAKV